jgi:hypothetical protein
MILNRQRFYISFLFFFLIFSNYVYCQIDIDSSFLKSNPEGEEIPVQVKVETVGALNISAFITSKAILISVEELFTFLKINHINSDNRLIMSGFFPDEKKKYSINLKVQSAEYNGKYLKFERKDYFINKDAVYLNAKVIDSIFGFKSDVDFKKLSVYIASDVKFPIVVEYERRIAREKSDSSLLQKKADVYFSRKRNFLKGGFLDWNLSLIKNSTSNDFNYNTLTGAEILGGDFSVYLGGSKEKLFDNQNTSFKWRFVDDNKFLSQGIIGDIDLNSDLLSNTRGVQITNASPVLRTRKGTYKIFDQTFPNWDVELFINNELYSFTKSDDKGFF